MRKKDISGRCSGRSFLKNDRCTKDSSGILVREPAAEGVKISHQICFKRLFEDLSLEKQNVYNLRSAVLLCEGFSRGVEGGVGGEF